jgi:hypothetical protein
MTNLFLNPGFELDFTDWTPAPQSSISTFDPQAGTKCVLRPITTVSGNDNIVAQFVSSLTTGISYTISIWVKPTTPPTPVNDWALTVFLSGEGTTTSLGINNNYDVWRKVSFTFIPTVSSQVVNFGYYIDRASSLSVDMFLDTALIAPTSTVCFGQGTKILCRTGEKAVEDLEVGIDEIYSMDGTYQIVQNLLITGPTNRLVMIRKGSISKNIPTEDIILTRGHHILLPESSASVKAINVSGRIVLKDRNHLVYSPYVSTKMIGIANGLTVVIDGQENLKNILDR